MGVYQTFEETPTSAWCSLPDSASSLAMRLDRVPSVGSTQTLATLYSWQGVFVPVEVTYFTASLPNQNRKHFHCVLHVS